MAVQFGRYNSSITRVRPFFRALLERDATGCSWLYSLIRLATLNRPYASKLTTCPAALLPCSTKTRPYQDRVLAHYGIKETMLEFCFEASQPPPERFLRWLIEHPEEMDWPLSGVQKRRFGKNTQELRERLIGGDPDTISAANKELAAHGAKGSKRKWWAFEGFTEVDCCLETDKMVLFIEGKRTEKLTPATEWYPMRNQIVRNLEVAQEAAKGRDYAVLVIAEQELEPITEKIFAQSLPHFSEQERTEIKRRYLGCTTWAKACQMVGVEFSVLPDTTAAATNPLSY